MNTTMHPAIPKLSEQDATRLRDRFLCSIYPQISVLKASANDLGAYMQGQLTQDVQQLSSSHGIYSTILTPKGKPISDMHLICGHHQEWLMLTRTSYAESVVARLRQFALGISLRTGVVDTLKVISIQGSETNMALKSVNLPIPESSRLSTAALPDEDIFCIRMCEASDDGVWVILPADKMETALASLDHTNNTDAMNAARILYGTPRFGTDWDEHLHPLNANLIEYQGISFEKGCYTGQEVTSRMHWRGGIKKALYHLRFATPPHTVPCAVMSDTGVIGNISSAAIDPQGSCAAIALLAISSAILPLHIDDGNPVTSIKKCHPKRNYSAHP